ncbi:MAG TPA: hypothetical protein VNS63_07055 [Blastocatellia bacterium]|nr:hypothetical protein [Blastocatellia bacterium]
MCSSNLAPPQARPGLQSTPASALSKTEFEIIEGVFHDGLGTYAEVCLANELIAMAHLKQPPFDLSRSKAKMLDAIGRLPASHASRSVFQKEISNIETATRQGAVEILNQIKPASMTRVRHTAKEYADAKAGDLRLELTGRADMPISVKTDKSGKVAVSEGQTPDIGAKWAERYFQVTPEDLDRMIAETGFASMIELKSHYLNVARLVALVLIQKLKLTEAQPTDFSKARVGDLEAAKYLFRRLRHFKHGNDNSRVIIFDRATGQVKWESLLDEIDIERLTVARISFLPSRPRGHPIASEFGIKIDGRTVVSFQIKHKRGRSRGTARQYEFSDITTRLRI